MATRTVDSGELIHDVTRLRPVRVAEVVVPTSVEEIATLLRTRRGPISVGGGRYSMGGQTAAAGGLQIDMRRMNRVLDVDAAAKTVTVEAGARWRGIQDRIDPLNLSIRIMQTYSNFTVGGSMSVNVHGRYVGLGPLILSVLRIRIVLADGSVVTASPEENAEIFHGAIGGYGGLGVIVEATLRLADNLKVKRERVVMPLSEYLAWFRAHVRDNPRAVLHNADIYPPDYDDVSAVTWTETDEPVTVAERLHARNREYRLERRVINAFFGLYFGKYYRRWLVDP